jgi:hypothetical protein
LYGPKQNSIMKYSHSSGQLAIERQEDLNQAVGFLEAGRAPKLETIYLQVDRLEYESTRDLDRIVEFLKACSSSHPDHPLTLHLGTHVHGRPIEVPTHVVTCMIDALPGTWKGLELYGIKLVGDMERLVEALRRQPVLEEFSFVRESYSATPIPLAACLSTLPSLKNIDFDFGRLEISDESKINVATSFARIGRLEKLQMYSLPYGIDMHDLFATLQVHTSLKVLNLRERLGSTQSMSAVNVNHAGRLLAENRSIRSFELDIKHGLFVAPIVAGLATNSTLRQLELGGQHFGESDAASFLGLLKERNFTLEYIFWMFSYDRMEPWDAKSLKIIHELKFYLHLNRDCQRKHLLAPGATPSRQDWVDVIAASSKYDIRVAFHYLSENPSLVLSSSDS